MKFSIFRAEKKILCILHRQVFLIAFHIQKDGYFVAINIGAMSQESLPLGLPTKLNKPRCSTIVNTASKLGTFLFREKNDYYVAKTKVLISC